MCIVVIKCFLSLSVVVLTLGLTSTTRGADKKTAELWLDKCARCHGDTGAGDTPLGRKLKVIDYSSKKAQEGFSEEHLRQLIGEGATRDKKRVMPAYKDELSKAEIGDLITYIKSLAK